jgi:hypothetical protein
MALESVACANNPAQPCLTSRDFDFRADTFSYANELVWEYRFDSQTGKPAIQKRNPPPTYAHHCFVVVRSARQFFLHAAFEPDRGPLDSSGYIPLIRAVVARSARHGSASHERVRFAGFANLRQFSAVCPEVLRAHCGGAWQSYVQRGNWRMVFPFSRRHQDQMAGQLCRAVEFKRLPIVHVVTFPRLTINHVLMLIEAAVSHQTIEFHAYDPNIPERLLTLLYNRRERCFEFPRTHYFIGGRVNLYEIYCGLFL